MQAILIQILGGLVRLGMGAVSGWLIAKGIITPEQNVELLAGITTALVGAAWMIWNKVQERRKLNTAAGTGPGTTVAEVEAMVKNGTFASALTPTHVPPVITNNTGNGK